MSFKRFLNLTEALSPSQKEYVNTMADSAKKKETDPNYDPAQISGPMGYSQHDDLFAKYNNGDKNAERIVIPITQGHRTITAPPKVRLWLESNGWDHSQYHAGLASQKYTDKMGNERVRTQRIGGLLKDKAPAHVYKQFETDPQRDESGKKLQVVISRNREDIGGMTSGRPWNCDSCMRLPGLDQTYPGNHEKSAHNQDQINAGGIMHRKMEADFLHGTLAAYLTKAGDDLVVKPSGRNLLKKHINTQDFIQSKETTGFFPENEGYGVNNSDFHRTLENFSHENWGRHLKPGKYTKHSDLYSDTNTDFDKLSEPKTETHGRGFIKVNTEGKQHTDDSSWQGMSSSNQSWDGSVTHEWQKEGKLHREGDLPATVKADPGSQNKLEGSNFDAAPSNESVLHYRFAKHGQIHRDGDKPAIYAKRSNGNTLEWYQHGHVHRDGDKPAVVDTFNDGSKLEKHFKYGMMHRDDDKPAYEFHRPEDAESDELGNNIKFSSQKWMQYGQPHRDGDKPAEIYTTGDGKSEGHKIEMSWYKNGELHRDTGPAHIDHIIGSKNEKVWFHHGTEKYRHYQLPNRYTENGKLKEDTKFVGTVDGHSEITSQTKMTGVDGIVTDHTIKTRDGSRHVYNIRDNRDGTMDFVHEHHYELQGGGTKDLNEMTPEQHAHISSILDAHKPYAPDEVNHIHSLIDNYRKRLS